MIGAVELLLRILAEGRPGHAPAGEAARILRRYGRELGGGPAQVVTQPIGTDELARLQRLGAGLFGPDFSAVSLLAELADGEPSTHGPEHRPRG